LSGREAVDSVPAWQDEAMLPQETSLVKLDVLNSSEADVIGLRSYVSPNLSAFHFGSLKFDNNKGPY
jgi:hypothetical protein